MSDERLGYTVALTACGSLDDKLTIVLLRLLLSFTGKDETRMKLEAIKKFLTVCCISR